MMTSFRSGARLGASLSKTSIHPVDEQAIAAVAEEVLAQVLGTREETLRAVIRNAIASPHHETWFQDVLEPFEDRSGRQTTTADTWRDSLLSAVVEYLKRGEGLRPFWAIRRRSLTVFEGGSEPGRRRRRPRLRLVQGGAS
jgi:hypothetical protein